mmetsp:Transcript_11281/g.22208  ORF Transcript_11281/g.22208 Transcript_11281/m.22208 type:complete len:190 (-) Transcript_11281:2653-3222(-)
MSSKRELLEDVQALEVSQLRTENRLLRDNIVRVKNILSGRNPMRIITGNFDEECQELLSNIQAQRQHIAKLEHKVEESSHNYESSLQESYEDTKTQAKTARGVPYAYLQQQVEIEESIVKRLEAELARTTERIAKEIADLQWKNSEQKVELQLLESPMQAKKLPVFHRSGAKLKESRRSGTLEPIRRKD